MSESISVRGETHQRLKDYCDSKGIRYGATCTEWIEADLDAKGVPVPDVVRPKKEPTPKKDLDDEISEHFTF